MTYRGARRRVALSVCLPMLVVMAPGGTVAQDAPAVVVHALDENAAPLPGGCFAIVTAEQDAYSTVSPLCDGGDGSADGTVTFGPAAMPRASTSRCGSSWWSPPRGTRSRRASHSPMIRPPRHSWTST